MLDLFIFALCPFLIAGFYLITNRRWKVVIEWVINVMNVERNGIVFELLQNTWVVPMFNLGHKGNGHV